MKSGSTVSIFLLDDDPIFRLGLIALIQEQANSNINIIAQGKIDDTLGLLAENEVDLLLISLDLAVEPRKLNKFVSLTRELNSKYPDLPILLITPWGSNDKIKAIANVKGCCPRNIAISELIKGIKICSQGKTYFREIKNSSEGNTIIGGWLYRQCQLGLREIEKAIREVNQNLRQENLSTVDIIFWQGRRRELKVVRWLVNQLLPSPGIINNNIAIEEASLSDEDSSSDFDDQSLVRLSPANISPNAIVGGENAVNTSDLIRKKIQGSLENKTEYLLEIDILQDKKKKELFFIILNEFQQLVEDIKLLNLEEESLVEKSSIFVKELWQVATIKFLSRYLSVDNHSFDLTETIFKKGQIVVEDSLINVPFFSQLLGYLVLEKDFIIDHQNYRYQSKSASEVEIILTENMLIAIATNVVQFILNQLSEIPEIKQNLFKQEWKSSRKMAMFRNNLVWRYRREKYFQNPRNIFEDEYFLLKIGYQGIIGCKITHPRHQELKTLTGIPWFITIVIEFIDSITRGVQALADILGKTVVFILTEILGRGIGLIGKGILQGIGSKIKN